MNTPPKHYSGRFITLDGSEGTGKSTQIHQIEQWLKQHHLPYLLTREPGGSPLGEQLRTLLLTQTTPIDPLAELLLLLTARRQHLTQIIWPALIQGKWVICDRFNDATYAYQGYGRQLDPQLIAQFETAIMGSFQADKRFLFHLDPTLAYQRLNQRNRPSDRIEQEPPQFFQRVHHGYQHRQRTTDAIYIDANTSIEQVFAQIEPHLESLL